MTSASLTQLTLLAAIIGLAYSVGIYEQCAGEGYGTFPCDAGLTCFRRNKWYSSCQHSCPLNVGWECEAYIRPVSGIAAGWDQCGGEGWAGPVACAPGYACYARSIYYSQCRPLYDCPAGWACNVFVATTAVPTVVPTHAPTVVSTFAPTVVSTFAPTVVSTFAPTVVSTFAPTVVSTFAPTFVSTAAPTVYTSYSPVILAPYAQCNGVYNAICPAGYGCFRNSAVYAECRPSCPATWACQTDVLGINEQCGGEGYVGLTRCANGLRCYFRSQWYAQCAASCPGVGWAC